ncbi:MAG: diguanylate cyclase [Candidatus Margulisiibacteriota bacterium]
MLTILCLNPQLTRTLRDTFPDHSVLHFESEIHLLSWLSTQPALGKPDMAILPPTATQAHAIGSHVLSVWLEDEKPEPHRWHELFALIEQLKQSNAKHKQFRRLYEATHQIYATLNIEKLVEGVVEALHICLEADGVGMFLLDNAGQLVLRAYRGDLSLSDAELALLEPSLTESALKFNAEKTLSYKRLANDERTFGVLVIRKHQGFHSSDDEELLHEIATHTSRAIENAQLFSTVEMLAMQDGLTELFNRYYFQANIGIELARAKRHLYHISLLMLDIDHFKRVNDHYGHQVGDEVLKHVADIFKATVRKSDIVARYGGEEMVGVLIGCSDADALLLAEKIREKIEQSTLTAVNLHTPDAPAERIPLTVSIGVSSYPEDFAHSQKAISFLSEHNAPLEEDLLVYMADKALYRAKKHGRNQVLSYKKVQGKSLENPLH